jgi:RNA-binding protein 26
MFDPETALHLKPWLVRTLEPMCVVWNSVPILQLSNPHLASCDAEPGALADYILALLKHNAPENDMRKELAAQLDEFLEKGPHLCFEQYCVCDSRPIQSAALS